MQVGDPVYLKFSPETRGTVSALKPDGRFRVTWFTEGRRPGQRRQRFWYSRQALATGIKVGLPA